MKILRTGSGLDKQRGLAMVEFTIVLPLLLLLMLATAEFGRALFQYNTLTKAVRDGARYLSANVFVGDSALVDDAAVTRARNMVLCGKPSCSSGDELLPGMTLADVCADTSAVSCPAGAPDVNNVIVTAQYLYQPMLGDVLEQLFGLDPDVQLEATTVMRIL